MADILVTPSILSSDFGSLADVSRVFLEAGADWLHLDVMDGQFVPEITFGAKMAADLRKALPNAFLDAHLMIETPERQVSAFADAGANLISVHVEATHHLDRLVSQIREQGCLAGVALCPQTSPQAIGYVIDKIDLILVMTVNPGYGGQRYLPAMNDKIREIRHMIGTRNIRLQVDGGINAKTVHGARDAGADTFVTGSYFSDPEQGAYQDKIRLLKEL